MRLFFRFSMLLALLLAVSPAGARDIFVDNVAGDDASRGVHPRNVPGQTGPVRTLAKALRLAGYGDRIVLTASERPYRESVALVGTRHSGYSFAPFTIEGNGATLDGSRPVPADAWENHAGAVFRFRPARLGPQQLFLNDRPAAQVAVERAADGPAELKPLQWCQHGGTIYFCVELTKLPEDYPLSYAYRQVGITLLHVDRVLIRNLTVQGFQLDGINANNNARRVMIVGVTCRGNGRSGIAVGGASLVNIDDCVLGNNGRAQLLTLPYSETHLHETALLANTAPAWLNQGGRVFGAEAEEPEE